MNFTQYYPTDKSKIKLTRNSRYTSLDHRYNIICRIKNFQKFMLIQYPLIFNMGQASLIATNNKDEALFILSLFNSSLNLKILKTSLKTANEKEFLVAIKSIKQYLRIPKITDSNQAIKHEIIAVTDRLLSLETVLLRDLVNLNGITMQKFDSYDIQEGHLILTTNKKSVRCKILPESLKTVRNTIANKYGSVNQMITPAHITLIDLQALPAIDNDRQAKIKHYLDDLVFALYFDIELPDIGFANRAKINAKCKLSKFYHYANHT